MIPYPPPRQLVTTFPDRDRLILDKLIRELLVAAHQIRPRWPSSWHLGRGLVWALVGELVRDALEERRGLVGALHREATEDGSVELLEGGYLPAFAVVEPVISWNVVHSL